MAAEIAAEALEIEKLGIEEEILKKGRQLHSLGLFPFNWKGSSEVGHS